MTAGQPLGAPPSPSSGDRSPGEGPACPLLEKIALKAKPKQPGQAASAEAKLSQPSVCCPVLSSRSRGSGDLPNSAPPGCTLPRSHVAPGNSFISLQKGSHWASLTAAEAGRPEAQGPRGAPPPKPQRSLSRSPPSPLGRAGCPVMT